MTKKASVVPGKPGATPGKHARFRMVNVEGSPLTPEADAPAVGRPVPNPPQMAPRRNRVTVRRSGGYEWDLIVNPFESGVAAAVDSYGSVELARERLTFMQEELNAAQQIAGIRYGDVMMLAKHEQRRGDSPLGRLNLALVVAEHALPPKLKEADIGAQRKPYPLVLGCSACLARLDGERVRSWRTSPVDRVWVREEDGRTSVRFLTRNGSIYEIFASVTLPEWHPGGHSRWAQ